MSKPIDLGLKGPGSGHRVILPAYFGTVAEPTMAHPQQLAFRIGVDLHLHRVHFPSRLTYIHPSNDCRV